MAVIPILIIGAGPTGSALAYGLLRQGRQVRLLDGGEVDFRASRANFGLVWQQGKGPGLPAYQELTARSVAMWPDFARELHDLTGIDVEYEGRGGLTFCLGEDGYAARIAALARLAAESPCKADDVEMVDRLALEKMLPGIRLAPEVSGASFGHHDGHCNPLLLLRALHAAILRLGGQITPRNPVQRLDPEGAAIRVTCAHETLLAEHVIIAAGLGSAPLARMAGLDVPLHPERGQLLVTEKAAPLLPWPASGIRQTRNGSFMLGVTKEEVGFDPSTTGAGARSLARQALRVMPGLGDLAIVRQWAGLRIMTQDSYPVYARSDAMPGVSVAVCHSAITLAAAHTGWLAAQLLSDSAPSGLAPFHHRRFDVSQTE